MTPISVLYLEDNDLDRRAFVRMVREKHLPWQVRYAQTLAAARRELAESRFDVIVADYHLPDGHGTELFDEVGDIPFVLLTGTLEEHLALRTLQRGADDYLPKDAQQRHLEALPFTVEKTLYRKAIHDTNQRLTREIQRRAEQLRLITDNAPALIAYIDTDLRYSFVNRQYELWFERGAHQIVGKPVHEVVGEAAMGVLRPHMERAVAGEAVDFEAEVPFGEGGTRWIEGHYIPDRDSDGKVLGFHILSLDITQRRQVEQSLRESEARFRAYMNNSPTIAWAKDEQGRHVYLNRAYEQRFGVRLEDWRGKTDAELWPAEIARKFQDADQLVLRSGQPLEITEETVNSDGSRCYWWNFKFPFNDAAGRHYVGGMGIDITERKQAEEELRAAQRSAENAKAAAEEASRAKDHFLAVLSHELRTPLAPVVAAVQMLQEQWHCDRGTHETLEMIRRNIELEARLIDDLLDVTRIVRGKVELDRRPVPLGDVIRRAVEVCTPDIEARQLHFGLDIDPCGQHLVHADAARLQQVFWNLLKNAIKFTPHGGCVGLRCRTDNDGQVLAEVIDSGEGIDPAHLPSLFAPFEQGQRSVTRQFGGLGLGLAIAKGLVELHGGSIEGHSAGKGQGATFRVRLPTAVQTPQTEAAAAAAAHQAAAPSPHAAHPQPPQPLRILLVEDHGDTARIMKRLLKGRGHEVQTAGDLATAMELTDAHPFDLLISDLGLPDGSGVDLMRELRRRGQQTPGIALSGYGQEQDIQRTRAAGFAAHLTKPVSPERLTRAIAMVAQTARSEGR